MNLSQSIQPLARLLAQANYDEGSINLVAHGCTSKQLTLHLEDSAAPVENINESVQLTLSRAEADTILKQGGIRGGFASFLSLPVADRMPALTFIKSYLLMNIGPNKAA